MQGADQPFYLIIIGGLVLLLAYSVLLYHRSEFYNRQFRARYFKLIETANTYLFEYDVKEDELRLSLPCARLLHLPQVIPQYLKGHFQASDPEAAKGLEYIDTAMKLQSGSRQLRIERQDKSLGVFKVYSETFNESGSKPVYIMGLFADVTTEFLQQEKWATLAQIDGLTKVYNAGTCRQQLSDVISSFEGTASAAFIILDVDHFKMVNDKLGHQTGDRVLQVLARTLKSTLRQTDFIGRLGGDEFCIYLGRVPSREFVAGLCARLNGAVTRAMAEEKIGMDITVSIGAGLHKAGENFKQVYERADQALYEAKEAGRNTFAVRGE